METTKIKFTTVDEYIAGFQQHVQQILQGLRKTIKEAAPMAQEVISYNMPAYKQHGVLVWFAGYKNHIGFYPSASPIVVFEKELARYKTSKGAIQFPIHEPLPYPLIKDIVAYRINEDEKKKRRA